MKQLMLFISLLLLVSSCDNSEVIETVLQAEIDNTFYRALDAGITANEDGTFLIQGVTQQETLTMKIASLAVRTYDFGGARENYASFENLNGDTYFTNPNGDGKVTISNYNEETQTASGSFNFNAIIEGVDTITVHNGLFYEAPILNLSDDDQIIDPATDAGNFVCFIDGNPFNPFNVSAVKSSDFIAIRGYTANRSITLRLPIDVTPDSYTLPIMGFSAFYEDMDGLLDSTSGNLIVFSHDTTDNKIKGTFFFLTPSKTISLGQFNVIYE